jgi:hypothetical protein
MYTVGADSERQFHIVVDNKGGTVLLAQVQQLLRLAQTPCEIQGFIPVLHNTRSPHQRPLNVVLQLLVGEPGRRGDNVQSG